MQRTSILATCLSACTFACSSADVSSAVDASAPMQTTFGGNRPTELLVPATYDGSSPRPLLMVLHGHSVPGNVQLAYTRLADLVDSEELFILAPDGLVNDAGNYYWNATPACCDFDGSEVDDASYLRSLIDDVSSVYSIDPKRIYLWGHSNGGFMSYRMACDHADVIAGIVSLAGAAYLDPTNCVPSEPVNILQLHGDADDTIRVEGGSLCAGSECEYPSLEATVGQWAVKNGCAATRTVDRTLRDIDASIAGEDTRVESYDSCPVGGSVDLWVIEGGEHIPPLRGDFDAVMWDWLRTKSKP